MPYSIDELMASLTESYEHGNYETALRTLEAELDKFPDYAQSLYFAKICLYSISGNPTAAIGSFQEAINSGLWFPDTMLRNDPDLMALQGHVEFERLVEISLERGKIAQQTSSPDRLFFPAASNPISSPLIIALHGNNGSLDRFKHYWTSTVANRCNILLPQSSQVSGPNRYVWNERNWAIEELLKHYEEVKLKESVSSSPVVMSGFSMGGGLAVWMALTGLLKTQGFIVVAPSLPDVDNLRSAIEHSHSVPLIRGYFIVGSKDTRSVRVAKEISSIMKENGLQCQIEIHQDLGHAFPLHFDSCFLNALSFVMGK